MDGLMPGVIGGIIGAIVVMIIFTKRANERKPADALEAPPTDLVGFRVNCDADTAVAKVYSLAADYKLTTDYQHPQGEVVIFGAKPNAWKNHYGYWLFVYVKPAPPGATDLSVGIRTKSWQPAFALNGIRNGFITKLKKNL